MRLTTGLQWEWYNAVVKKLILGLSTTLIFILLGILFIVGTSKAPLLKQAVTIPSLTPKPTQPWSDEKLFNLVNDYRVENNESVLDTDPRLCASARERIQQLSTSYEHDNYGSVIEKHIGRKYGKIGENLNNGLVYEEEILYSWIGSVGHNKSLLDSSWTHMCIVSGLGIDPKTGEETRFNVQHFYMK